MASGFPGFSREAMDFFRGLERHNNRDWFQPRKAIFEEHVKTPMMALVEEINGALRSFSPDHVTDPAKAVYRIYRDTRFSKDKTPYKTQAAASFHHRVNTCNGAGYYFSVSHKELAVGGGMYMPTPESLRAVRERLAERHAEFRKILKSPTLRKMVGDLHGEQLTRVPKGFDPEHEAADLLRYKQYFLYVELPVELAAGKGVTREIVKRFRAMAPFLEYLNAAQPKAAKRVEPR
jgi:uncharacterized protein (TIGR02453 family)